MIGSTALQLLKIELDKQDGLASALFINSELYYFLSSAYKSIVDQKIQQYEIDQIITDDLREFIVELTVLNVSKAAGTNQFQLTQNTEFQKLLRVEVMYDGDSQYMLCNRISIDNINPFSQTKFNIPYVPRPVYYEIGSNVYVLADPSVDTINAKKICLTFTVPSTSEMQIPDKFADNIIQLALSYALENIESQRTSPHYQLTTATNP